MIASLHPLTKDTGIDWLGRIPASWPIVRLKYLAEIQTGLTLGKNYGEQTLVERPYLRVANVQDGFLDLSEITTVWVPAEDVARHELRRGDVLMTEGGDFDKLGRGYVWEGQIEGCLHQNHVFAVRPVHHRLESHFLAHLMTSAYGRAYFTSTSQQTTNLASTNSTKLGDFPVPLPSMSQQRSIVAYLDRKTAEIDAVIAAKERMLGLLQEKRLALISQAVTRGLDAGVPMKNSTVEWLGQVPAHWAVERLTFSLTLVEQGWSPQCDNRLADEDEWGVLKVGCVNGNEFDPSEQKALPDGVEPDVRYEITPGDILLSRGNTRELVGSASLVREVRPRLLLCDLLYRLRVRDDRVDPDFLVHQLRSRSVRFQIERDASGTSSSMKKIGQETIREFLVCLPPLPEQKAIAEFITRQAGQIDATVRTIRNQTTKLREYRQAVISAAVTGKLGLTQEASS